MSFDLFSLADEAPQKTPEKCGGVSAHIPGFESMKPETQQALATVVQVVAEAASAGTLPGQQSATSNHALAFVAACKSAGLTDPALKPVTVSAIGRCDYDVVELARLANELLRGVRSDRPELTPARWQEAGEIARKKFGRWHVSVWRSGVLTDCYAYRGFEKAAAARSRWDDPEGDPNAVYTVEFCTKGETCTACSEMIRKEARK